MPPGAYDVAKINGYIIGIIGSNGHLLPLNAPRKDFDNNLGRVQVRVDGEVAHETVGIKWEEALSRLFFCVFVPRSPENLIEVVVRE